MILIALAAAALIPSSPALGTAAGACRPGEAGPPIIIAVEGLTDRRGTLRAELYPDDDPDFLADDNILVSAGKAFRRAVAVPPTAGPVRLCLRAPAPGAYSLSVVHDRSGGPAFSILRDGIGFANNPVIRLAKPHAAEARIVVGPRPTPITIIMNYHRGLMSFGPLDPHR